MSGDYAAFLARKLASPAPVGLPDARVRVAPQHLKPFQLAIVRWALARGRAAVFADTGLGKSRVQLAWADAVHAATGGDVLVLAPLAVAEQTAREGAAIGVPVAVCDDAADVRPGVNVTNYDRLHRFDPARFAAVALDESSILKGDGPTRAALTAAWAATPYRLALTATPAPNDHVELGNHAAFLGICTPQEMLATYFVHDGGSTQDWRLKGHAVAPFWRWVTSWAVAVRRPSDLGFDDAGYDLPGLDVRHHVVAADDGAAARASGLLFALPAATLAEQRAAKRASIAARVARVAALVAAEPDERWLVWGELNDECDAIAAAIPGAVQVAGSDDRRAKAERMLAFARGEVRALVSKAAICGFGMNFQACARQAFLGVSHSYEQFYQAVRRSHRFGQTRPVVAHVVSSALEAAVVANLRRKEADAARMQAAMVGAMRASQIAAVRGAARETLDYEPRTPLRVPAWLRTEVA